MQEKQNITNLVWFRNDLRVQDNDVLSKAYQNNAKVIAIYCVDPRHFAVTVYDFKKAEKFRARFLLESLRDLKLNLEGLNIDLLVYHDLPETIIPKICKKYNINNIHLQKEWTQEEVIIENRVKEKLNTSINWHTVYNQFLFHPEDISIELSTLTKSFTAFRKKLEKEVAVRPEIKIEKKAIDNRIANTTTIPTLEDLGFENFNIHTHSAFPFSGGESAGLNRLEDYIFNTKKVGLYKKTRNGLIGTDYSSKFSSWLANGSISARNIYWKVKQFEKDFYKNESTYWLIFELIWRDYFKYVSLKYGNLIFRREGILKKKYEWSINTNQIRKWIHGQTQSDFVNANMLELKATGWMSNRGRQNVASFFAKELELDWRIGAAYFESQLIDYDAHSNYGNWMYVAGVGNDPRDRKCNVQLQAERYDPNGNFRELWLQPPLF